MAALNHLFALQEQICYVRCGYCTNILLVSVPLNSLSMVVNVRCGHCTSLLSVDMLKTSLVPLHLFASLDQDEVAKSTMLLKQEICPEKDNADDQQKAQNSITTHSLCMSSDEDGEDVHPVNNIVINKPPEKRQRPPSAYNQFIKEEIRRLKATYPDMTHKQAFTTAAKNWSHFPLSQRKGDGNAGLPRKEQDASYSVIEKGHVEGNGFHKGKISSHAC